MLCDEGDLVSSELPMVLALRMQRAIAKDVLRAASPSAVQFSGEGGGL
jgi:hypothetical protein